MFSSSSLPFSSSIPFLILILAPHIPHHLFPSSSFIPPTFILYVSVFIVRYLYLSPSSSHPNHPIHSIRVGTFIRLFIFLSNIPISNFWPRMFYRSGWLRCVVRICVGMLLVKGSEVHLIVFGIYQRVRFILFFLFWAFGRLFGVWSMLGCYLIWWCVFELLTLGVSGWAFDVRCYIVYILYIIHTHILFYLILYSSFPLYIILFLSLLLFHSPPPALPPSNHLLQFLPLPL
jgi:hypothetical protein